MVIFRGDKDWRIRHRGHGRRLDLTVRAHPPELGTPGSPDELLTVLPLVEPPGLRLVGEIDISNRARLRRILHTWRSEPGDVHLELGALRFIDVGGVTVIVHAAERLEPGRRLILDHAPLSVRRIVHMFWRNPSDQLRLGDPE